MLCTLTSGLDKLVNVIQLLANRIILKIYINFVFIMLLEALNFSIGGHRNILFMAHIEIIFFLLIFF
jgi:hypothetical protein